MYELGEAKCDFEFKADHDREEPMNE